jgi:hypothetical protein
MRATLFIFFCLGWMQCQAQVTTARSAWLRLQKGEYQQAHQLLVKAMRKEVGPAHFYVWARYYSVPNQPFTQIDSAHAYSLRAASAWRELDPASRAALTRFPLDSIQLQQVQVRIDSLAFERARALNTEAGYQAFVAGFPDASQVLLATELAAEVSYLQALQQNTEASYANYVARYPTSNRAVEAGTRLDRLRFEAATKSHTKQAYQQFYKQYPDSRFRLEALRAIFNLQTVSANPADLVDFIETYPGTSLARHTAALLFYLDSTQQKNRALFPDSLLQLQDLNGGYWVPFLEGEKYGFLNQQGEVAMDARFRAVPTAYRCEPVTTDFITADGQLFLRNGKQLAAEAVREVAEIGGGFVLMHLATNKKILHKTGFVFLSDVESAKWLANRYLAVRMRGRWGIFAINGFELVAPEFEEAEATSVALILHRNSKRVLVPLTELPKVASGTPLSLDLVYDDVKDWGRGRLWVKNGSMEGVLNERLEYELPLARQRLVRTSFGHLQIANGQTKLAGLGPTMALESYPRVQVADPWLVVHKPGTRAVFSLPAKRWLAQGLDSVWFAGKNAWGQRADSTLLFSATRLVAAYASGTALEFIPSTDSVRAFLLTEKNRKMVYNLVSGRKQFVGTFDKIQQAGEYFIVTQKGKRGVLDATGKVVVAAEYDEIVFQPPFLFSLVKNKMFGWYDGELKKVTKPLYDRNVRFLGLDWLLTGQRGNIGVLSRAGAQIFPFELEDAKAWTDSLLWVRRNQAWQLVQWPTGKILTERVRSFQMIHESAGEKCVRIKRESGEGVWSSRHGELIPATFSEVQNLGDETTALYLAMKDVKEVGITVVAYFNSQGKLVRRQALENDELERLLCDEE